MSSSHRPPGRERAACACPLLDGNMEEWIKCCAKRFLRLARSLAGGDEHAEDVLQESWIHILRKVGEYRGGSPACAWVRAIVANCARDVQRAGFRAAEVSISETAEIFEDPAPGAEASIQREQLYRLLDAMVQELPQSYRQVVELCCGQGLSPQETADRLHISKSNVGTRLNRAVNMLRRIRAEAAAPLPGGGAPS